MSAQADWGYNVQNAPKANKNKQYIPKLLTKNIIHDILLIIKHNQIQKNTNDKNP